MSEYRVVVSVGEVGLRNVRPKLKAHVHIERKSYRGSWWPIRVEDLPADRAGLEILLAEEGLHMRTPAAVELDDLTFPLKCHLGVAADYDEDAQ